MTVRPGVSMPTKNRGAGNGHPIMFGSPKQAIHFGSFPEGGGYPKGFLEWAFRHMSDVHGSLVVDPSRVLHLCSGSVATGVTVDIRPEKNPTIVADCRDTGLPDESFDFILADPPYSEDYARNLYGTGAHYPRPGQITREASRLLRPNGLFGFMHHQVPMTRRPLRIVSVFGITQGAGFNIRAWTLCRKVVDQ